MTAAPMFPKPEPRAKERKPWRRSKPIRARRARRLDDPKQSDPARLTWVHFEMCEVRRIEERPGYFRILTKAQACCRGRVEAAHEGEKKPGIALKSPDGSSIALCRRHHRQWTDHVGAFAGWGRDRRRDWADRRGAATQARYLSHGNRRGVAA